MSKYTTALVTGGAGFIGSHIVDALIRRRIKVYVVDDLSTGNTKNVNPNAHFTRMSILNPQFVEYLKRVKPDVIFHTAAQINLRDSVKDPMNDAKTNILGSLTIAHVAGQIGIKKIIFSSSGASYPESARLPWSEKVVSEPVSPYAISKRSAEMYFHFAYMIHGVSYVALRYANVYGPRQNAKGEAGVISVFTNQMLRGKPSTIFGTGKQTRDFIFVEDVVAANIAAMNKKVIGVFNIGTGKETDVNTIFHKLQKFTHAQLPARHEPASVGEVMRSSLDCRKAREILGWKPSVKLDEGLEKTVIDITSKNRTQ
ncbi:NAD-dependent epimerase/dehydratase family protein [Candidatus Uhrbacteria bacterium]|nr:NAD-dependent epimerase/dehydratase family protein [Candidatus Uhrbacteria bacterium]